MTPENIALVIAGIIWPMVFQLVNKLGLADKAAQWAAVVLAYAIAAAVQLVSTGTVSPDGVISGGSLVATLAAVVYRQIIKDETPPVPAK